MLKFTTTLAVAALLAIGLAATAVTASAPSRPVATSAAAAASHWTTMEPVAYVRDGGQGITPCITGMFCTYTNSNFSGEQLSWFWPTGCWNLTNQFNNTMSSFRNHVTGSIATIHDGANCSTLTHWGFPPPADIANLNALPYWPFWNDVVSSVSFS